MTAGVVEGVLCENCPATDARCAARQPLGCCPDCTHVFGEPPPSIEELLERARGHDVKRIASLGARIRGLLDELGMLLEEDADRADLRAEVQRLEGELAAAKAKLRPPGRTPARAKPKEPCPNGCGRMLAAQGRRKHLESCHEAAS